MLNVQSNLFKHPNGTSIHPHFSKKEAIAQRNGLFYYLDPYEPSYEVYSIYNGLVLVLNFTNNLVN